MLSSSAPIDFPQVIYVQHPIYGLVGYHLQLNDVAEEQRNRVPVANTAGQAEIEVTAAIADLKLDSDAAVVLDGTENGSGSVLKMSDQENAEVNARFTEMSLESDAPVAVDSADRQSQKYSREFIRSIGDLPSVSTSERVACLISEEKLTRLGLDLKNMPKYTSLYKVWNFGDQQKRRRQTSHNNGDFDRSLRSGPWDPVCHGIEALHRAENAWKPGKPADEVTKILKEIRGLLNKITHSTKVALTAKFLEYKVHKHERIRTAAVAIIHEKAVNEPLYCSIYCELCKAEDREEIAAEKSRHFGNEILAQAWFAFDGRQENRAEAVAMLEDELAKEDDPRKKKAIAERLDELKAKHKRRILGNIGFIGELYRNELITQPAIHWCLVHLVRTDSDCERGVDESAVESAIKMLTSVGKIWVLQFSESPELQGEPLSNFVDQLADRASEGKYSPRIRFLIADLQELYANNWDPLNRKIVHDSEELSILRHKVYHKQSQAKARRWMERSGSKSQDAKPWSRKN